MKILQNGPSFKLVELHSTQLLFIAIPKINYVDKTQTVRPIDLKGLGNTSGSSTATPWLVTATSTRTSYIFFAGEKMSDSYVKEKLHLYNSGASAEAAQAISKLIC